MGCGRRGGGFHQAGVQAGVHWLTDGLRSPGYPPRSPPAKYLFYCDISGVQGWLPGRVASQKNRSDASDAPDCAPPHTNGAGRNHAKGGMDPGWTPGIHLRIDSVCSGRTTPSISVVIAIGGRSVSASGVSQKSVSRLRQGLTRSCHGSRITRPPLPPRIPSTASPARASRSTATR